MRASFLETTHVGTIVFKFAMIVSSGVGFAAALIRYALEIPTEPGSALFSAGLMLALAIFYAMDAQP